MPETFYISDTHFGHRKIILFDKTVRPFETIEEHDEALVKNWNSVVKPQDLVWHLGDVMLDKNDATILTRLNGRKKGLFGNHDSSEKAKQYLKYGFESFEGYKTIRDATGEVIVSHIPVAEREISHRFKFNIHGHLHNDLVLDSKGNPDLRYINVSAERINLTPINYDELKEEMKRRLALLKG